MTNGVIDEREYNRAAAIAAGRAERIYAPDPMYWSDRGNVQAPAWGVRNVKFSKCTDGKEVLVFTEVWPLSLN